MASGTTFDISHHAAEIGVKPFAPLGSDDGHTVLSAKDNVVMEGEMRGWHGCDVPAPLAGARTFSNGNPVADATG
jgi:hypothetical protein